MEWFSFDIHENWTFLSIICRGQTADTCNSLRSSNHFQKTNWNASAYFTVSCVR